MRVLRGLLAAFVFSQLIYLITMLMGPYWPKEWSKLIPMPFKAGVYIWSILILPMCVVSLIVIGATAGLRRLFFAPRAEVELPPAGNGITRRQLLTATLVALPPVATAMVVARAVPQMLEFRIRRMQLRISGLPPALDGLRIAHVSDLHVGPYSRRPQALDNVVAAVNKLDADLVLFTGDLIDRSLDDLPDGIRTLKRMNSRHGLFIIEGNHDLFQDADEFDSRVREAGLKLLLDEAITIPVRGEQVQILGTRWGAATGDRRLAGPQAFADSIQRLARLRDPKAFPILMAHHPHTFDPAAAAGFPLTLSGHTHGGLFNLTPNIGFGPIFYRYWSGWYEKPGSQLVVSNGIGNWFPLRINTPAEIIDITLKA